jgi:hypothetical protein
MKLIEWFQKETNDKIQELQSKIDSLNKELGHIKECLKSLPMEINEIDDCNYASYFEFRDYKKLHISFESEDSIKQLKMLGIQGFKKIFYGSYFCNPNDWRWGNGKLEKDSIEFEFGGGKTRKPVQCRIEEYEEPSKPAEKRLRAICNETGEQV